MIKDVPSSAAEFAQPDVLVGASILAYRYEGLRRTDLKGMCVLSCVCYCRVAQFCIQPPSHIVTSSSVRLRHHKAVVRQLKTNLQMENGPKSDRPAFVLFEEWVGAACRRKAVRRPVMNLELFQTADAPQMNALFQLVAHESEVRKKERDLQCY